MGRQSRNLQQSNFANGMITDKSAFDMTPNSALDVKNMEVQEDGSLKRRNAWVFENDFTELEIPVNWSNPSRIQAIPINDVVSTYSKHYVMIRANEHSDLFPLINDTIYEGVFRFTLHPTNYPLYKESSGIYTPVVSKDYSVGNYEGGFIYGMGDDSYGILAVNSNGILAELSGGRNPLKMRDFFGISTNDKANTSFPEDDFMTRITPAVWPPANQGEDCHVYNLFNQGWGMPVTDYRTVTGDPITMFYSYQLNADPSAVITFPSNADSLQEFEYPDPHLVAEQGNDLWHSDKQWDNPIGMTRSPKGHFIIDVVYRAQSRIDVIDERVTAYPSMTSGQNLVLPIFEGSLDEGPFEVASHAGRLFYTRFYSSESTNNFVDSRSINITDYIFYSQLISSGRSKVNLCYQNGDPTSKQESDLLPTDGGYIRINEAKGIVKLLDVGTSLIVFCGNGVWTISGGASGFSATSQQIKRLTSKGCVSANSVILAGKDVYYWSEESIFHINTNSEDNYEITDITEGRIKSFYREISKEDKANSSGAYHEKKDQILWMYGLSITPTHNNEASPVSDNQGLFYKRKFKAFTRSIFAEDSVTGKSQAFVADLFYNREREAIDLLVVNKKASDSFLYLGLLVEEGSFWSDVNFGNDETFGIQLIDVRSSVKFGNITGGDLSRDKKIGYLTTHYQYDTASASDIQANVRAMWNWSNDQTSGKWSDPQRTYRIDPRITGSNFDVVTTRVKIRGKGKNVVFEITDQDKGRMHLLGWSMYASVETDV